MQKFIYNLTLKIMEIQFKFHRKRLERLHQKMLKKHTQKLLHEDIELTLNNEIETKKTQINNTLKEIISKNQNNPEKLLDFIKESGTDVYRINNANIFLKCIGEEEGFIPPLKGLNAFLLNILINFIVHKKILIS